MPNYYDQFNTDTKDTANSIVNYFSPPKPVVAPTATPAPVVTPISTPTPVVTKTAPVAKDLSQMTREEANASGQGTAYQNLVNSYLPTAGTIYNDAGVNNPSLPTIDTSNPEDTYNQNNPVKSDAATQARVLQMFQAQIDATNEMYAQKLAEAKQQGLGRLGSVTAMNARGGLLGSDFGATRQTDMENANAAVLSGVRAEQAAKLAEIQGLATRFSSDEIARKNTARKEGLESYLKNEAGKLERKKANIGQIVDAIANQGFDINTLDSAWLAETAKRTGVTVEELKAAALEKKAAKKAESRLEPPKEIGGYIYTLDPEKGWVVSGTKGGTGTGTTGKYTVGANPTVDAWAERIQAGTAKITDIPASQAGLRNQVTVALNEMGNSPEGKPTTTEMGKQALQTAKDLMAKFNAGSGTSAVGKSRLLGYGALAPSGTEAADFTNTFQSVKDQLSLDAVKYLKGQGQVSDAERALLAQAVTKLNLSQSEEEFKKTLQAIINKLESGTISSANAGDNESQPAQMQLPDGTTVTLQADGTYQ